MVNFVVWVSYMSISCVGSWGLVGLTEVYLYKVLRSFMGEDLL